MRIINETFEDEEFDFLKEEKGKLSWRKFILKSAGYKNVKSD